MSGFKGTPGPWQIGKSSRGDSILSIGPCIADEYAGLAWLDVTEEDAQLISAAPELLEALELLSQSAPAASCDMFHHEKQDRHTVIEECPVLIRYEHACMKARAAIAKALGEQK